MQNIDLLLQHRNDGLALGTRDILIDLFNKCNDGQYFPVKMNDIYCNYMESYHKGSSSTISL